MELSSGSPLMTYVCARFRMSGDMGELLRARKMRDEREGNYDKEGHLSRDDRG